MIFYLEWSTGSNRLATYGVQVQSVHVHRVTYSTEPDDSRCKPVAYPGILFGRGVQQIQFRTEDTERGSGCGSPLPPSQGFWRQLYSDTSANE